MKDKLNIFLALIALLLGLILPWIIHLSHLFVFVLMILFFPLVSIVDLIASSSRKKKLISLGLSSDKFGFLLGYPLPFFGVVLLMIFLDNIIITPLEETILSISAALSLIGQLGQLLRSLNSNFLQFKFKSYLIFFFLSYITCALSFAALYKMNIEGLSNINPQTKTMDAIYFSFITLSTTGYGDISPCSTPIKLFVILENIVGLFLTGYVITMIFNSSKNKDGLPPTSA